MVLHPLSSSQYQVLGETYCGSLISGETILEPLPGNFMGFNRHDAQTAQSYWAFLDKDMRNEAAQ